MAQQEDVKEIGQVRSWHITCKLTCEGLEPLELGTNEIQSVNIGIDVNSGVPAAKISYKLEVTDTEILSKKHICELELINKKYELKETSEIYKIKLQSITQITRQVRKKENKAETDPKFGIFEVSYFCYDSLNINNEDIGGVYHDMTLEEIIKDLYKKTGCALKLNLSPLTNKTKYENIYIPLSQFSQIIKYLNSTYGLYDSPLIMYSQTFNQNEPKEFIITNMNDIKSEHITLNCIADKNSKEKNEEDTEQINEKVYYIFKPINIDNSIATISQILPKKYITIALPSDKFFAKKEIDTKTVIKKMKFTQNMDQFNGDKNFNIEKRTLYVDNEDSFNYAVPESIQKIVNSAVKPQTISIPNPFLISHFKIGNIIDYQSHIQDYLKSDVSFFVYGFLLILKQNMNIWNSNLILRLGTLSIKD